MTCAAHQSLNNVLIECDQNFLINSQSNFIINTQYFEKLNNNWSVNFIYIFLSVSAQFRYVSITRHSFPFFCITAWRADIRMYSFLLSILRLRTTKGLAKMFVDSLPVEIYFCVRSSLCARPLDLTQSWKWIRLTRCNKLWKSCYLKEFLLLFFNFNIIYYHSFLYRSKIFCLYIKTIKIRIITVSLFYLHQKRCYQN